MSTRKKSGEVIDEIIDATGDASILPPEQREEDGKAKPSPRKRIREKKPKLDDMIFFLMDMRLRLRFAAGPNAGQDASRALMSITPEDAEMMEDIADVLVFFEIKWGKLKTADKHWPLVESVLRNRGLL